MKQLTAVHLEQVSGARDLPLDMIGQVLPQFNWDDMSPDMRFQSGLSYKKPFDPCKAFKALNAGQSYTFDMLSESGDYVMEIEISLGNTPMAPKKDLEFHLAAIIPA